MKNILLILISLSLILAGCKKYNDPSSQIKRVHHPTVLENNSTPIIIKSGEALPTDTPFVLIDTVYGFIDQNGNHVDTLYVDSHYMVSIPTNVPGAYGLTYVATNTAGYQVDGVNEGFMVRTLLIYDDISDANPNDISGVYNNEVSAGGSAALDILTPGVYLMDNSSGYNQLGMPYNPSIVIYHANGNIQLLNYKLYGIAFNHSGMRYEMFNSSPSTGDKFSYTLTIGLPGGTEYIAPQVWIKQ